ncbi:MAG: hypothetical protein KC897_05745 [Candidatus Omnitrophica bacterium]|nr:hypothetical protein [Candidatus Omnitrophota bacterium]MCB9722338.1 hypothetical protein [Candidatus Omnitrophota bacterium]
MSKFLDNMSGGQKKAFYVLVFVVVAGLFYLLYVGPVMKRIHDVEQKIAQKEEEIQEDLAYLSSEADIIKESKQYEQYVSKELKSDDDIGKEFFSSLRTLSQQANVTIEKDSPSDTVRADSYIKYYADLTVSGELRDVVSFMHLLNSTGDLFKIVEFTMTPSRDEDDVVTTSMTVVKLVLKPNV